MFSIRCSLNLTIMCITRAFNRLSYCWVELSWVDYFMSFVERYFPDVPDYYSTCLGSSGTAPWLAETCLDLRWDPVIAPCRLRHEQACSISPLKKKMQKRSKDTVAISYLEIYMHAINPFPITSSNVNLVETSKKLEPGHAFHCIFLSPLVPNASIFFMLDSH